MNGNADEISKTIHFEILVGQEETGDFNFTEHGIAAGTSLGSSSEARARKSILYIISTSSGSDKPLIRHLLELIT